MNMRPAPGSRLQYRGAFSLWLALTALPAAAQVGPLTSQSLFFNQASNANTGNYLAANAGVLYTSNAQYTSNGSGDTLLTLGLGGDTSREGTRLDYHLDSDLMVLKYLGGTFGTQLTGYADGKLAFKIVPGLFSWIARETYTQLQIDPYAPATPDNLESLNYITTGPRFAWSPTLRTSVTLEGLYSYVSSSSSSPTYVNLDSHRYGGNLNLERAFSSTSSLYIKGRYEKVDFKDQEDNNNFSVAEGVGGFRVRGARTDFDISGGYSRIQVQDILTPVETILGTVERPETETFGGPIWTLNLSRLITPSQRVALFATQQFTDAAAAFRLNFDQPVPTIAPLQVAAGDPYQSRTFGADWRFETLRSSIDISVLDGRIRYVVLSPNENNSDVKSVHALFARQLSPVLNWDIGASYSHSEYAQPSTTTGQTAVNWTTALTDLRWRVGERVALRFLYAYSSQNGLHDNQLGIIASYALVGGLPIQQQEGPQLLPTSPESMQWQSPPPQPTPPASTQPPPQ
jgi:hypothetical protein